MSEDLADRIAGAKRQRDGVMQTLVDQAPGVQALKQDRVQINVKVTLAMRMRIRNLAARLQIEQRQLTETILNEGVTRWESELAKKDERAKRAPTQE